ncbi:MAG TPA: carbon-nitrogen hydrolase family protein [Gammaproteobacteria bacterium]|nr:carbon-nitrogen hydrolase family protein [Gammaproteobacteria bacterium]
MKAAAVQMQSGADVAANLEAAEQLLRDAAAAGATLAVLPENFAFLAVDDAGKLAMAEQPGRGPVQDFLGRNARDLGLWLVGGTLPLRGSEPRRTFAASLLYGPDGTCKARYDKVHLFDVGVPGVDESYRESATTIPGNGLVSYTAPFGRLGMVVCYDIRFPALFDSLGASGTDILSVPAAFTVPTGEAHWQVLLRARAIESLCYVVAAAQWGVHPGGRRTYGHSMIVGPWGEVLAQRPRDPGIVVAELDIMRLETLRTRFPALAHRRSLE